MAAASSATGATIAYNIASQKNISRKNRLSVSTHFKQQRRLLISRNSVDENVNTTEVESGEIPVAVEVPKGPPSLISALNVEKARRGIAITDADHYGRLGLQSGCSYDQVNVAYKNKLTQVMNQGLAEEELSKELELLKESNYILSSKEERRLYDWSLARIGEPDRYTWPFKVDITQIQFEGIPPPREPEDEGPTRAAGYFILSWLILSFTLFILLNR